MSKIKRLANKVVMGTKKHSPAILTGAGIIGLGATAWLAYKSREKVEAVVENIEQQRELAEANQEEFVVDKLEVARDLTEAVYLPVVVGVASVTAIFMSYRIQNRRIAVLAGSLAASQLQNKLFEEKYKKTHGEEAYNKFILPVEEKEVTYTDDKGKTKKTVESVKQEVDKTTGQWYDESLEYVSDDHGYNVAMIDSVAEKLELILFQRGTLLLNEVREALGFERIRAGALLGWTSADSFNVEKVVTIMTDEKTGEMKEHIWVTWARPRYIYDEVEFNGRYAVNA